MTSQTQQIILASRSPRRRELLEQIGVGYEVLDVEVDESHRPGETPGAFVTRLALAKASTGSALVGADKPVLGADTIVVLANNMILGKPANRQAAAAMLAQLSGQAHRVMTAVALVWGGRQAVKLSTSTVTFRPLSAEEIAAYCETGEPDDKAGAYAIQGLAALFISHLEGSFSGVMGLPLFETAALLTEFEIPVM